MINRVILIVMDSVGVGHLPDARRFNDDRTHTLLHIYQQTGRHAVGRVIARPFVGTPGKFERHNAARKDFSATPPAETLLDILRANGFFTIGIGKIGDPFGRRALSAEIHTTGNQDGVDRTLAAMKTYREQKGLIFVNLVDFDMLYGHRRDVLGYAAALEVFDRRIPEILRVMGTDDLRECPKEASGSSAANRDHPWQRG
jgi:phosphopentomutase